jgi:hypothetical protein
MVGGGSSVLARGEEEAAFIAGCEAVGCYLHVKQRGVVVWGTVEGGGDVRAAVGQWWRVGRAVWPVCKRHVAPSRGPTRVTLRD